MLPCVVRSRKLPTRPKLRPRQSRRHLTSSSSSGSSSSTTPTPTPPPPSLTGRHILVTGASRGIGLATARLLAAHGASLTLVARSAAALETARASLTDVDPPRRRHEILAGDVSRREFWSDGLRSLFSTTTTTRGAVAGRLDGLVNAAGVGHRSLFLRTAEGSVEEVVRTNLLGTMWACREVGRVMLRQKEAGMGEGDAEVGKWVGKGVIVNVSSLLGVRGGFGSAAYAASKAGVIGFSRALAAELGSSGIRVNTILPGYVTTDMTDAMDPKARDSARERIPMKRFGTPDEVADAVLFLVRNAYAHNCVLNLDGGLSADVRIRSTKGWPALTI